MVGPDQEDAGLGPAHDHDSILNTKVRIPPVRSGYLNRSRLIAAIDEGVRRDVTLVCAPAGWGKTTLLAEWASRSGCAVAWLSLDGDDNDPSRFWRYVAVAIARVVDVSAGAGPVLGNPEAAAGEGLILDLTQELDDLAEDLVLVLDDYHAIDLRAIHDGLGFLLDHQPRRFHIVISSRADPPLHLARLRAGDRMAELRSADLRFTAQEAASFLDEVWELGLSAGEIALLQDRTEGWAVGMQLAALSLRGHSKPVRFIEDFTGSNRYVIDYLTEEVFAAQADETREFLMRSSILSRMRGSLCDVLTGRDDGQAMLEKLDRENVFLVALDDDRTWYRFHHLFRDSLEARLRQVMPAVTPELHRRAASWLASDGQIDEAIRHALAADDAEWAADLVEENVEELLIARSERVTLDRWLAALPQAVVEMRPRILLAQGIAAQVEGRPTDSRRALMGIDPSQAGEPDEHESTVGRSASILANVGACTHIARAELARMSGDAEEAARLSHEALALLTPRDEVLGTFASYQLSMADWMRGDLDSAEDGMTQVIQARRSSGRGYLSIRAAYDLGCVQRAQGRLSAAMGTYERAHSSAVRQRQRVAQSGMAQVGMAEILRQRGDLDSAKTHATEGVQRCRHLAYAPPLAAGLSTLAWVNQANGEPETARQIMAEAVLAVPDPGVVSLIDPAPSSSAHLALAQSRIADAISWADERGITDEDNVSYPDELDYLVLARIFLAQDLPDRALGLLTKLGVAAESDGRWGSLIRIRTLLAATREAIGERDAAIAVMSGVLSMARTEGYVSVFVDEGPPVIRLLRLLAAPDSDLQRLDRIHLNRILRSIPRGEAGDTPATARAPDPLTDRELEVLRLMAAGMRNKEIADEIWIALDTVKKHVSHILTKLAVTNRTEAVTEGRRLGLLDPM